MKWTPKRIRALRGALTQQAFAERVGVSSFMIVSRWETGTRKPDKRSREALDKLERGP